jgi:ribonuclease HII
VATEEAIREINEKFKNKPNLCLIDGKEKLYIEKTQTLSIISGDSKSINIAAASILAKVTRDNFMKKLHNKFPIYN